MKQIRTPGLRILQATGQKDWITYVPTCRILEVIVGEVNKPNSVLLELHGWWYDEEIELKRGEYLKLAEGLTVCIHDFRKRHKVCLQYTGPREIYHILRYELIEKD